MPTGGGSYFDAPGSPLPSSSAGVSNIGFLPSSSGSQADTGGGGGFDWSKIAGAGGGLLGALFAPKQNPDLTTNIRNIEQGAGSLKTAGTGLTAEGSATLAPVLKYFQALASGDPSQALAATQPQRGRVIDQYDAARRSAAQFTPRGGGQASTEQASRAAEAGQLADVTAQARAEGAKEAGTLGSDVTKTGLSAEEQSINAMVSTLQPLLQQQQQQGSDIGNIFSGIGELAGALFL